MSPWAAVGVQREKLIEILAREGVTPLTAEVRAEGGKNSVAYRFLPPTSIDVTYFPSEAARLAAAGPEEAEATIIEQQEWFKPE